LDPGIPQILAPYVRLAGHQELTLCFDERLGGLALSNPKPATVSNKLHYVHQDGQAVFKYALRKMGEASEKLLQRNGFTGKDVNLFVLHQANKRIISSTATRLGLSDDQVVVNIDEFGNTTAGTIPLALESARQQGRLILIAAVGAGFTTGAALLRWAY
jgi:3-oxoacyl-[acyl-carrier-protein] synthase-3